MGLKEEREKSLTPIECEPSILYQLIGTVAMLEASSLLRWLEAWIFFRAHSTF